MMTAILVFFSPIVTYALTLYQPTVNGQIPDQYYQGQQPTFTWSYGGDTLPGGVGSYLFYATADDSTSLDSNPVWSSSSIKGPNL